MLYGPLPTTRLRLVVNNSYPLILIICAGLYIGTSPVYWLPWIPVTIVMAMKTALFAVSVISILAMGLARKTLDFPKGYMGLSGFYIITLTHIPSFAIAPSGAPRQLWELTLGFISFFVFYQLTIWSWRTVTSIFKIAGWIMVAFVLLHLFGYFSGQYWPSPYGYYRSAATHGFGGARTGWSIGLALMLPLVYFSTCYRISSYNFLQLLRLLFPVSIVASQLIVAGRGGLVASVATTLAFSRLFGKRVLYFLIFISAIMTWRYSDWLTTQLRMNPLMNNTETSYYALNEFSTGRLDRITTALKAWWERPLTGWGFGPEGVYKHWKTYGHMFWPSLLSRGGIFVTLAFGAFIVKILASGVQLLKKGSSLVDVFEVKDEREYLVFTSYLIVLIGLIVGLFEAGTPLGPFHTSAVWWCAAGTIIALSSEHARADNKGEYLALDRK